MDNLNIYTYTNYDFYLSNILLPYKDIIKIISPNDTKNINPIYKLHNFIYIDKYELIAPYDLHFSYCELSAQYYLYLNPQNDNNNYIGFQTNRKIFDPYIIKDAKKILKNYDIIAIDNDIYHYIKSIPVFEDYSSNFNIDDLLYCCELIKKMYNVSDNDINTFLQSKVNYHHNLFITSKEIFNKWGNFIFPIIDQFIIDHKFFTAQEINLYIFDHFDKYYKEDKQNINRQLMVISLLGEFLFQLFIQLNNYKIFGTFYIDNK